jgi:hypothetical protein
LLLFALRMIITPGAALEVACITNAALDVKDVNKAKMLSQLTSHLSYVTISNTRAYDYHMWPPITFADYVDIGERALWCADNLISIFPLASDNGTAPITSTSSAAVAVGAGGASIATALPNRSNQPAAHSAVASGNLPPAAASSNDAAPRRAFRDAAPQPAREATADMAAAAITAAAAADTEAALPIPVPNPIPAAAAAAHIDQQANAASTPGGSWEATLAMAADALAGKGRMARPHHNSNVDALLLTFNAPSLQDSGRQEVHAAITIPPQVPLLDPILFPGCQSLVDLIATKASATSMLTGATAVVLYDSASCCQSRWHFVGDELSLVGLNLYAWFLLRHRWHLQQRLNWNPNCAHLFTGVDCLQADSTLREGLMLMLNVVHPYFYCMSELVAEVLDMLQNASDLTSPFLWQEFVLEAEGVAYSKGCSNLQACYGGLLVDI